MAIHIVNGLEVVEVKHDETQRGILAAGHCHQLAGVIFAEPAVVKTSERVNISLFAHGLKQLKVGEYRGAGAQITFQQAFTLRCPQSSRPLKAYSPDDDASGNQWAAKIAALIREGKLARAKRFYGDVVHTESPPHAHCLATVLAFNYWPVLNFLGQRIQGGHNFKEIFFRAQFEDDYLTRLKAVAQSVKDVVVDFAFRGALRYCL